IEEFRLRFGDRVHKHLFHGGALTPQATAARWTQRADQIDLAVIAESARWGDYRRDMHPYSSGPYLLYTRNAHWVVEKTRLLNDYFPRRTDIALNQFRSRGFYPSLNAPVFHVNDTYQHGGHVASRSTLAMSGTTGTVWYTLEGTDPRVPAVPVGPVDEVKLVAENAAKRVLVPTGPVSTAWRGGQTFNDAAWIGGTGGVGFERGGDYAAFIQINVQNQMYNRNTTCCVRIPFTVSAADLAGFSNLILRLRYDDGFVAYLNGAEIARKNFTGEPAWNSAANAVNASTNAISLEPFNVTAHLSKLRPGQNILALHGLNQSLTSTNFLISAELVNDRSATAGAPVGGVSPTAVRYTAPVLLSRSVQVRSRALSGTTWSALNEAVFAVGPVAQSLRVSEIMYHPPDTGHPDDPNTEFIELTNIAGQSIDLSLVRFTRGIGYTFPSFTLPPGGYCLVVQDLAAFAAKYGADLPVIGQYTGRLDNSGERVELVDAAGQIVQSFTYSDKWFKSTDGRGHSLTVKDPRMTGIDTLNDKEAWRPSTAVGGSPGTRDDG
ncbi:MAG: lamin tail domain-containing protein, partial [Planctomycetes bacterium]|nr:lamin tail domain-containing protein [Planctomycetota bacterium]